MSEQWAELVDETCRFCGRTGLRWEDLDPAPGVCPTCLDARMATMTEQLAAWASVGVSEQSLRTLALTELTVECGLTEAWAERFVSGDFEAFARAMMQAHGRER